MGTKAGARLPSGGAAYGRRSYSASSEFLTVGEVRGNYPLSSRFRDVVGVWGGGASGGGDRWESRAEPSTKGSGGGGDRWERRAEPSTKGSGEGDRWERRAEPSTKGSGWGDRWESKAELSTVGSGSSDMSWRSKKEDPQLLRRRSSDPEPEARDITRVGNRIEVPGAPDEQIHIQIPYIYKKSPIAIVEDDRPSAVVYDDHYTLRKPFPVLGTNAYRISKPKDEFSVDIMQSIHHKNVLHMEADLQDGPILVDSITGELDKKFIYTSLEKKANPLAFMQSLMRQMIKGAAGLAHGGRYHGNLENTIPYYTLTKQNKVVLKLKGFRGADPGEELAVSQSKDLFSLGKWIEHLVDYMKDAPPFDLTELTDLSKELKKQRYADDWEEMFLKHHFFWGKPKRKTFLSCSLPKYLELEDFLAEIDDENSIKIPWGKDGYCGLVKAMDDYREKENIGKYDKNLKIEYLRFTSGCYTHEEQIKKKIGEDKCVDIIFRDSDPAIVQKVINIYRRSLSRRRRLKLAP